MFPGVTVVMTFGTAARTGLPHWAATPFLLASQWALTSFPLTMVAPAESLLDELEVTVIGVAKLRRMVRRRPASRQ